MKREREKRKRKKSQRKKRKRKRNGSQNRGQSKVAKNMLNLMARAVINARMAGESPERSTLDTVRSTLLG